METRRISENTDPSPPLSSLRLLVPPLRLISAAMWQVAQRRDVMDYGKLEEFVTLVTETVPELLTYRQRAQLILGLRARLILELCRGEQPADLQTIQPRLDRMCPSAETPTDTEVNDAEVEASEANFLELVQTLLKDPAEREHFFQEVFPVDYGPKYDAALQMLVWEFLSRLEHLLPVPDLTQTVSWLSDAPSGLEDCVQPVCHPQQLKSLLQHFRCRGHLDMQETRPTATDDSILSSLSTPPCPRVVMSTEHTEHCAQSEPVHDSIHFSGPTTVGEEVVIESMVETMYCTVELDTGLDRSEHSERETQNSLGNRQEEASNLLGEEESAVSESDRREMSRGLQRQSKGREGGWRDEEHMGSRTEQENQRDELMHGDKTIKTTQVDRDLEDGGKSRCDQQEGSLVASSLHQQPSVCIHRLTDPCNPHHTASTEDQRGETLLQKQKETDDCAVMPEKQQPESSQKGNCAKATNESSFSPQKKKTGHTDEVVTKVFACSKCPFFHVDKVVLQQHVEELHPKECSRFQSSGENGAEKSETLRNPAQCPAQPSPPNALTNETTSGPEFRGSHKCSHCGKIFRTPSDLTRHQRTHAAERPFPCAHCDKSFKHPWDRTRHQRTHTEDLSFHCSECGTSFRHSWSLTLHHQRTHKGENQHCCSRCGKGFESLSDLTSHKQTHAANRHYRCQQCGKSFESLLERSEHRQSHAVKRLYKCPQCDKCYTRSSDVRRHQINHAEERPFQCTDCGKSFALLSILNKHQQTHTGERPYPCSHCQKRFNRLSILTRHERIHTGERPYLCSQCGKSFLSFGELTKHQKWHTEERPHLCSHCGKGFKMNASLKKHQKTHTGERPYRCSVCNRAFTGVTGLSRHQLTHTGERPYSCPQCGKTFLSSGELLKHQRFHTGERPFQCSQCGKTYTQSCYLTVHQRTHTGERPYHCSQCRKSFSCSTQLKRHMRLHTGEKPFQCAECGKSFNRSCLLNMHQKTHTGKS